MTTNRRTFLQWTAVAAGAGLHSPSRAQALDRPVRVIVAYAAGGASDSVIRYAADRIKDRVGQPVVVENRPGADGNIAAEAVLRSNIEGHRVLVSGSSTHAANATIYGKLPFDPERDFTPLTTLCTAPYILVVNPQRIKATSVQELVALGKAGSLTFASANVGGRIAGELFKSATGLNAINVPYASSAQAMTDLIGGQYDYYFCDSLTAMAQIRAGKITPLAVSIPSRMQVLPDVPTVAESGYAGFDVSSWIAAWSAASTPPDVSRRLAEWINGALDTPEGRKFLTDRGLVPYPGNPEQLRALQARDTVEWGKVIRAAGMVKS